MVVDFVIVVGECGLQVGCEVWFGGWCVEWCMWYCGWCYFVCCICLYMLIDFDVFGIEQCVEEVLYE